MRLILTSSYRLKNSVPAEIAVGGGADEPELNESSAPPHDKNRKQPSLQLPTPPTPRTPSTPPAPIPPNTPTSQNRKQPSLFKHPRHPQNTHTNHKSSRELQPIKNMEHHSPRGSMIRPGANQIRNKIVLISWIWL